MTHHEIDFIWVNDLLSPLAIKHRPSHGLQRRCKRKILPEQQQGKPLLECVLFLRPPHRRPAQGIYTRCCPAPGNGSCHPTSPGGKGTQRQKWPCHWCFGRLARQCTPPCSWDCWGQIWWDERWTDPSLRGLLQWTLPLLQPPQSGRKVWWFQLLFASPPWAQDYVHRASCARWCPQKFDLQPRGLESPSRIFFSGHPLWRFLLFPLPSLAGKRFPEQPAIKITSWNI